MINQNPQEKKAIICPNCGKLISNYLDQCPHCGVNKPARKSQLLKLFGSNNGSYVKPIIIVNSILFILSYILPFFIPTQVPSGRDLFGILPAPSPVALNLLGWSDIRLILNGQWWVLITAVFLHGGLIHIFFNMMWVKDLGPQTEMLFSPHKMLIIYILSGVFGNLVAVFTPVLANTMFGFNMRVLPVIGASGAIFGLLGALVAYGKRRGGVIGRQIVSQFGKWALIIIAMGFFFSGVSNAAHIGGFIGGYLLGRIIPLHPDSRSSQTTIWIALGIIGISIFSFVMMILRLIRIINGI